MKLPTHVPSADIEPGLLETFAAFVSIRFLFVLLSNSLRLGIDDLRRLGVVLILITVETAVLLVYLRAEKIRGAMGKFFLPVGLGLLTLFPVFEIGVREQGFLLRGEAGNAQVPVLTLLTVVVLIAWQYSLRNVFIYCFSGGTAVLVMMIPGIRSNQVAPGVVVYSAFSTMVFLGIVGYIVNRLVKTQKELRAELALVNEELYRQAEMREQLATTRERNRLAGELHDILAHAFSALTVELEAVRSLWHKNPERSHALLTSAMQTANTGLDEARRAVRAMRAAPLENFGLALAIQKLAADAASRGNLKLTQKIEGDFSDVNENVQQCLYRIASEAIANTLQHARAGELGVILTRQEQGILLKIWDDGKGFQTQPALTQGFGLQGMRTRAQQYGGVCEITSHPKRGTTIQVYLPERPK